MIKSLFIGVFVSISLFAVIFAATPQRVFATDSCDADKTETLLCRTRDGLDLAFAPAVFESKISQLGLKLEVLTVKDQKKLVSFMHAQFRYAENNPEYQDIAVHFAKVVAPKRLKNYQYWILKNKVGEVVAGIGLTHPDVTSKHQIKWFIDWFAVSEKYKGHSLGKFLIAHTERRAREMGIKELYIYTSTSAQEASANALYESFGYKIIQRKQTQNSDGAVVEDLFRRKQFL